MIKFGRKKVASVGSIATDITLATSKITSITVTIDEVTTNKINSIKLIISTDAEFSTVIKTIEASTIAKGELTFDVPTEIQNTGLYYKVVFDCASGSSNGLISISKVVYTGFKGE